MIRASIAFFLLAIIAYFLGANQIAGISLEVGKLLLWAFLAIALISLIYSILSGRNPNKLL